MTQRLILLAAAAAMPMPALAQHAGHEGHDQPTATPAPAEGTGDQSPTGDHAAASKAPAADPRGRRAGADHLHQN